MGDVLKQTPELAWPIRRPAPDRVAMRAISAGAIAQASREPLRGPGKCGFGHRMQTPRPLENYPFRLETRQARFFGRGSISLPGSSQVPAIRRARIVLPPGYRTNRP